MSALIFVYAHMHVFVDYVVYLVRLAKKMLRYSLSNVVANKKDE